MRPWILLVVALLGVATTSRAQDTTTTVPPTTSTTIPDDSHGFETPRSAMRGFMLAGRDSDWTTAATYLDLRDRDVADGPRLARELRTVIDRKLQIDLDAISAEPGGDPNDGQTPRRDLVATIETPKTPTKVLLERVNTPEGPQWKLARATVSQIPVLWAAFGDGPLADVLPEWFFDLRLLDVALWQWLGLAGLILGAALISWLLTGLIARIALPIVRKFKTNAEGVIVEAIVGPLRLVLGILIVSAGTPALWLALPVHRFIVAVEKSFTIVFIAWILLRLTDALARIMEQRWLARGQTAAISVVPLGRRTVKAFVGIVGLLALMATFGFNVTAILAGLGVGGLAVALAAQKTIENLFGGVTLVADQPVRVGDFCRFGDRTGTVEDIGLRSTRIRTADRTVVTIPNADFSAMQIENFAPRDRFLLSTVVSLRYETTADQLRWVLLEVKRMLLGHPKIDADPARVRLIGFGALGLDVELSAYVRTPDANEFFAVREDVFLRLIDIIAASGTAFAVPPNRELDDERRKETEAEVARWRQEKKLYLVRVPTDEAQRLKNTLDWPPAGSPDPPPKPGQR